MRFVDFKLKVKFFWAFASLILIALFLSINAIYTLYHFDRGLETVTEEVMPEFDLANNISQKTREVAYFMQGYIFSGKSVHYDQAKNELESLKQIIVDGEQMFREVRPGDAVMQRLNLTGNLVQQYEDVARETYEINEKVSVIRLRLENSRSRYMDQCRDALKAQENLLRQEIARGTTNKSRTTLLYTIGGLLDLGHRINILSVTMDISDMEKPFDDIRTLFEEAGKNINLLRSTMIRNDNGSFIGNIENAVAGYKSDITELADHIRKQSGLLQQHQVLSDKLVATANELRQGIIEDTAQTTDRFSGMMVSSIIKNSFAMLFAIIVAVLMAAFISRMIAEPLNKGVGFAHAISKGDLTAKLDIDQKDEIGDLASSLQHMSEMMRQTIAGVTAASDNMANASLELSSTSQSVSQGASEQASSAEEVSSAIEEMAASIEQNTENAKVTEKISTKVETDIGDGKEKVDKTVKAIREIADKISIIGDIAFQTNILALNAAVEAARAGEHGRGFGVIAAEVGKLAERSKIAALEIDRLTNVSVSSAEDAGQIMNQIVPEIRKTSDLIREIVVASVQQNAGADQINIAIQQLNQVTQQNAAASEELATNAVELSTQAENLQQTVSFFKVVKDEKVRLSNPVYRKNVSKSVGILPENEAKGVVLNMDDDSDSEFERF